MPIRTLIVVVSVIAVDCAWLRHSVLSRRSLCGLDAPAFDVGVLAMGSILALGLYRLLSRRGREHHFLVGFEVFGTIAIIVHMICCRVCPDAVRSYLEPLYTFWRMWWPGHPNVTYLYLADAVLFTLPQLCFALVGGLLARLVWKRTELVLPVRARGGDSSPH